MDHGEHNAAHPQNELPRRRTPDPECRDEPDLNMSFGKNFAC